MWVFNLIAVIILGIIVVNLMSQSLRTLDKIKELSTEVLALARLIKKIST